MKKLSIKNVNFPVKKKEDLKTCKNDITTESDREAESERGLELHAFCIQ